MIRKYRITVADGIHTQEGNERLFVMPIFEYKCHKCGKIFTKQLKDPLKKYECECGAVADKIVSAPAWRYDHTVKGD